jgi:carbamoyl-phosphate synthase large subunit
LAARAFVELGFKIAATVGTAAFLEAEGVEVASRVAKLTDRQGDPHREAAGESGLLDAVKLIGGGEIQLVVNTPRGRGPRADGAHIRRAASAHRVPILTTVAAARAAAAGIADWARFGLSVMSIQEHHEAKS